jgi:hypothetical protein
MKNVITSRTIHNRVLAAMAAFLFVTSGIASAQAGKTYSQLKAEHPGWVQVPGALTSPDCVHQIPSGATVDESDGPTAGDITLNGKLIAHYNTCAEASIPTRHIADPGPTGNGWVEDSQWLLSLKSGDNIDFLGGSWSVPSIPETYGALIYLFNGIQPSNGSWIMQPVLQFGDNGNFGGDYWVLASWLVHSNTDYYVSSPVGVNPGDVIIGQTYQTGVSGNNLYYLIYANDVSNGQDSTLSVKTWGLQWSQAFAGVLEAYNVTSCSEYPSGSQGVDDFYKTTVAHGYPKLEWLTPAKFVGVQDNYFGKGGPFCSFKVDVSGGSSTLYF